MSNESIPDLSTAWAWYDPETGYIKHVTFIEDQIPDDATLVKTVMESATAVDIITGVSSLTHYKVVIKQGAPTVTYIATNLLNMVSVFWTLRECVPFDKKWSVWDDTSSPVRLVTTDTGYDLYVVSYSVNTKLYITLKEDPSWLIKTVDIQPLIANNGLGPIPIALDMTKNYSMYVRQDATQYQ